MLSTCPICAHPDRAEIENAILALTTFGSGSSMSIETIAQQYHVSLDDLKMHAVFHTPILSDSDIEALESGVQKRESTEKPRSLTAKMRLREIDILSATANEYLVTLKAMGSRINRLVRVSSIDEEERDKQLSVAKLLTKPMVDLYVSVGGEIRQTVRTMAEVDHMLNGPEDNAGQGLVALAAAIRQSDAT